MTTDFTVTTPIYYVNAAPHLGHAYTTLAADVLARHARQRGARTFSLTGTDEHGEPIAHAAAAQSISPQELVDANAARFRALIATVDATPDFFVRTTDVDHRRQVGELLERLYERDLIYKDAYEGLYCPKCADFKNDREAPDGRCAEHGITLEQHAEENWFFRLSAFEDRLLAHLDAHPEWITPASRAREAHAIVAAGLQDVSISRANLSWGIPVPWDTRQVFYVWFDALLNYITAPASAGVDAWPATVQLIGKDILKFHAIFWSALLWALELELPERLVVHGYLLVDGRKASKSRGNVIDPVAVVERFGADALRFGLFTRVPWLEDGSLSAQTSFADAHAELADVYGNLVRRIWTLTGTYAGGQLPAVPYPDAVGVALSGVAGEVAAALEQVQLTAAASHAIAGARALNGVVDQLAPWTLKGDPSLPAVLAGLV